MSEYIVRMSPDMPYEIRAELNAWYVNSEPIVRCGDCEYYIDSLIFYNPFCSLMNDRDTEPNGFCAWGVRRGR